MINNSTQLPNLDDQIFRFIYIESIRDAVRQLAYPGEKKWLEDISVFSSVEAPLKLLIQNILDGCYHSAEEYNTDFLQTAIVLCNTINARAGNQKFTFGNAQKLINLMVKYFYICSYGDDSKKTCFSFCHCPMDQTLLEKVWKQRTILDSALDIHNFKRDGRDGFLKSWGQEEFKEPNGEQELPRRYLAFQEAVRILAELKSLSPLEYDYCIWAE